MIKKKKSREVFTARNININFECGLQVEKGIIQCYQNDFIFSKLPATNLICSIKLYINLLLFFSHQFR